MNEPTVTGLRWGELFWCLSVAPLHLLSAFLVGNKDSSRYGPFWLSWVVFAAFVGLTVFLMFAVRDRKILRHIVAALIILFAIGLLLIDQYAWRVPQINWLFDGALLLSLVASARANRSLPVQVRVFAVPLTALTFGTTVLWSLGSPAHIFLPILFFPTADLPAVRALFCQLFLSGVVLSALVCALVAALGTRRMREKTSFLESPISRQAKGRMILGVVGFVAVAFPLFYFLPGTSSGGGGAIVEYPSSDVSGAMKVPIEEVDQYLREIHFESTNEPGFRMSDGVPVAWYRYQRANPGAVDLCLWRTTEGNRTLMLTCRYKNISAFEARRVRGLLETTRKHFRHRSLLARQNAVAK